jgi:hypothetical protein
LLEHEAVGEVGEISCCLGLSTAKVKQLMIPATPMSQARQVDAFPGVNKAGSGHAGVICDALCADDAFQTHAADASVVLLSINVLKRLCMSHKQPRQQFRCRPPALSPVALQG